MRYTKPSYFKYFQLLSKDISYIYRKLFHFTWFTL